MKIVGAVAVVFVIGIAVLMYRRSIRSDELAAQRAEMEREARQHVDLSALPEPLPEEKKPEPVKFKKKPIVVEMKLQQKKGKALKPFHGKYQLISANGEIVGQDEATGDGAPAVFIVNPGVYQLLVPGTKFRKELTFVGNDEGKMHVDVVIAAK